MCMYLDVKPTRDSHLAQNGWEMKQRFKIPATLRYGQQKQKNKPLPLLILGLRVKS
jgi:hypothetical protein